MINVNPTADAIEEMARQMRATSDRLMQEAANLRRTRNFDDVGTVASLVSACFGSLRLDLLVLRPVREFERERRDAARGASATGESAR